MKKLKVLMVNETSYTLSGFGTYGKEVLHRLNAMDKYHIAEFAGYGQLGDPRDDHVRWRYYPNAVSPQDKRAKEYESKITNQFGEWRFERVLLDFQPDIVFDIRDPWMFTFEAHSPLRKFYNWAIMPTVDSAPQQEEWMEMFRGADGVFSYSDWGLNVLEEQGRNQLNLQTTASPGVDLETFQPVVDKQQHRMDMGLKKDVFIIGTVMRNQKRKLYPDLFKSFRMFLDRAPQEIADKTYLYVHTSYPDHGWDIPSLLKEYGISNKTLFTYICKATKRPFVTLFQDAKTYSPLSNAATGTLPSVAAGLTQEEMAQVYNLMDVYIQYSICEGFGMPQVEAAACGVPVMAVDYSAMVDVIKKTDGIALKVQRMFREMETGADRALPDNDYCASMIESFFSMDQERRDRMSKKARAGAEKYYNWDYTAQAWADYFDSANLTGLQGKWGAPLQPLPTLQQSLPKDMDNPDFIRWLFTDVLGQPEKQYGFIALTLLRELNYGVKISASKISPITRKEIFNKFNDMAKNKIICEQARCGFASVDMPDYIKYAQVKEDIAKKKKK